MARRPDFPASVMTREELNRLKRPVSMLSPHTVRHNYRKLLERCRSLQDTLPTPRMMQELVTLWKVLWRWPK
jgi:hypothetical protein